MDQDNIVAQGLQASESCEAHTNRSMTACFALQVHQDPILSVLGDKLQDIVEVLVVLVDLAQRFKDSVLPTHIGSKTYVLIRIVNIFAIDGEGGPIGSDGMLLESPSPRHDDHLPVTTLLLIQLRLQD